MQISCLELGGRSTFVIKNILRSAIIIKNCIFYYVREFSVSEFSFLQTRPFDIQT